MKDFEVEKNYWVSFQSNDGHCLGILVEII